jgi:hypothetical protein
MFHGIKFVPILFHPLIGTSLMLVAAKLMATKLKIIVWLNLMVIIDSTVCSLPY